MNDAAEPADHADDHAADPLAADLALAIELAELADAISLSHFRAVDLEVRTKPDRSPVTEADLAVERAIVERIAEARPGDGVFGEEFGISGDAQRQWIIDPIDGTANFLRGVPVWATLIALAVDGEPVVGVVSAPAMQRRWWAARGRGAWTTESAAEAGASGRADAGSGDERAPRRLRVSAVDALEHASLSFNSLAQWRDAGRLGRLLGLAERVWRDRAYGDMWSYMLLAEGLIDVAGEFGVKRYDVAALVPVIEEAGGRWSDVHGGRDLDDGSSIATNGALHGLVLDAVGDPDEA